MITDMRYIIRDGEKVLQAQRLWEIGHEDGQITREYRWQDVPVEKAND